MLHDVGPAETANDAPESRDCWPQTGLRSEEGEAYDLAIDLRQTNREKPGAVIDQKEIVVDAHHLIERVRPAVAVGLRPDLDHRLRAVLLRRYMKLRGTMSIG